MIVEVDKSSRVRIVQEYADRHGTEKRREKPKEFVRKKKPDEKIQKPRSRSLSSYTPELPNGDNPKKSIQHPPEIVSEPGQRPPGSDPAGTPTRKSRLPTEFGDAEIFPPKSEFVKSVTKSSSGLDDVGAEKMKKGQSTANDKSGDRRGRFGRSHSMETCGSADVTGRSHSVGAVVRRKSNTKLNDTSVQIRPSLTSKTDSVLSKNPSFSAPNVPTSDEKDTLARTRLPGTTDSTQIKNSTSQEKDLAPKTRSTGTTNAVPNKNSSVLPNVSASVEAKRSNHHKRSRSVPRDLTARLKSMVTTAALTDSKHSANAPPMSSSHENGNSERRKSLNTTDSMPNKQSSPANRGPTSNQKDTSVRTKLMGSTNQMARKNSSTPPASPSSEKNAAAAVKSAGIAKSTGPSRMDATQNRAYSVGAVFDNLVRSSSPLRRSTSPMKNTNAVTPTLNSSVKTTKSDTALKKEKNPANAKSPLRRRLFDKESDNNGYQGKLKRIGEKADSSDGGTKPPAKLSEPGTPTDPNKGVKSQGSPKQSDFGNDANSSIESTDQNGPLDNGNKDKPETVGNAESTAPKQTRVDAVDPSGEDLNVLLAKKKLWKKFRQREMGARYDAEDDEGDAAAAPVDPFVKPNLSALPESESSRTLCMGNTKSTPRKNANSDTFGSSNHATPQDNPFLLPATTIKRNIIEVGPVQIPSHSTTQEICKSKTQQKNKNWKRHKTITLERLGDYIIRETQRGQFGGRLDFRGKEPTGFFHVKRIGDRWTMVDPEGFLFTSVGVNSVTPQFDDNNENKPLDVENATVWAKNTYDYLFKKLCFNSLGCWSDPRAFGKAGIQIPYCTRWSFMQTYCKKRKYGRVKLCDGPVPSFDPEFETFCDEHAKGLIETCNDPWIVGHFSDNELPFKETDIINRYLSLPETDPGHQAATKWLLERGKTKEQITAVDHTEFCTEVISRYLRIVSTAVRKYDPNHMFFGARFHGVVSRQDCSYLASSSWVDVVCVNYFQRWTPEQDCLNRWSSLSNRPILISELSARGEDAVGCDNTTGAGLIVPTQKHRAFFYENFTIGLMRNPNVVGWHWFRYIDKQGSNFGIVDAHLKPYDPLAMSMHRINSKLYSLSDYLLSSSSSVLSEEAETEL